MPKENHCNQCGEEMTIPFATAYVCTNPECPNYGLAQLSQEEMIKYK